MNIACKRLRWKENSYASTSSHSWTSVSLARTFTLTLSLSLGNLSMYFVNISIEWAIYWKPIFSKVLEAHGFVITFKLLHSRNEIGNRWPNTYTQTQHPQWHIVLCISADQHNSTTSTARTYLNQTFFFFLDWMKCSSLLYPDIGIMCGLNQLLCVYVEALHWIKWECPFPIDVFMCW